MYGRVCVCVFSFLQNSWKISQESLCLSFIAECFLCSLRILQKRQTLKETHIKRLIRFSVAIEAKLIYKILVTRAPSIFATPSIQWFNFSRKGIILFEKVHIFRGSCQKWSYALSSKARRRFVRAHKENRRYRAQEKCCTKIHMLPNFSWLNTYVSRRLSIFVLGIHRSFKLNCEKNYPKNWEQMIHKFPWNLIFDTRKFSKARKLIRGSSLGR